MIKQKLNDSASYYIYQIIYLPFVAKQLFAAMMFRRLSNQPSHQPRLNPFYRYKTSDEKIPLVPPNENPAAKIELQENS